jgi:hypothetical protein
MRYRKKPVEVEAVYWAGVGSDNTGEVIEFCGDHVGPDGEPYANLVPLGYPRPTLYVAANHAYIPLEVPTWIIRDKLGLYPCDPAVFNDTYQPVHQEATP